MNIWGADDKEILHFLSCLFGSEFPQAGTGLWPDFLSCLFGSEFDHELIDGSDTFLSCLFGSEYKAGRHLPAFLVSELPIRQ